MSSSATKTSGMQTCAVSDVVCRKLVNESLQTHSDLTSEDVRFCIYVLVQSQLSEPQLASFVLHSYQKTNTGRFALCFNTELDVQLKARDTAMIEALSKVGKARAFPELMNNTQLTRVERDTINKMYEREYYSILNVIQHSLKRNSPWLHHESLLSCDSCTPGVTTSKSASGMSRVTLYSKCYQGVCIHQENLTVEDVGTKYFSSTQLPSRSYVTDKTDGQKLTRVYCFNLMTLLKALATTPCLNPTTGNPFSPEAVKLMMDKYGKEVKMYCYYLQRLQC